MIVFTNLDPNNFIGYFPTIDVMNINSYIGGYPLLRGIFPDPVSIPEQILLHDTEPEFDQAYIPYLLSGPGFSALIHIAKTQYEHPDVLHLYLIESGPYTDSIIESLCMALSDRYGMTTNIVIDAGDIGCINMDPSMSVIGLNNIMKDLEWLSVMDGSAKDESSF